MKEIEILHGINPNNIPKDVINSAKPVVFKQLVRDWPMVQAGLISGKASTDYLWRSSAQQGTRAHKPVCKPDVLSMFAQWENLNSSESRVYGHGASRQSD